MTAAEVQRRILSLQQDVQRLVEAIEDESPAFDEAEADILPGLLGRLSAAEVTLTHARSWFAWMARLPEVETEETDA